MRVVKKYLTEVIKADILKSKKQLTNDELTNLQRQVWTKAYPQGGETVMFGGGDFA